MGVSKERTTAQLILSMADTTWRMFTPPALTVSLGLWADLNFGTKPWLTILATVIGLALSIKLVKMQMEAYE
jgi:hypothetical protein